MNTLIFKDLRENLKVALIGLLVLSLLLLHSYQFTIGLVSDVIRGNVSGQANNLQPLLSSNLLTDTAFFCAIFGAALGWLQARNEGHRDLWAFLIHRPITRTQIFLAKAIAGLCLYVLGAALPLLVLVAVVVTPGHVAAPFEWPMVMPLAFIFLSGIAYYFAGLLTGLRQARWYASRSFGLGCGIIASFAIFDLGNWWSLLWIALAIMVAATAAWGAYQTGGFYRGQPVAGRAALVVTLAAGCFVVLYLGVGLLFALLIDPWNHHNYTFDNYQLTRDGGLYKVTSSNGEQYQVLDLDGHPLLDPHTGRKIERGVFQKQVAFGGIASTRLNPRFRPRHSNMIEEQAYFFNLFNVTDRVLWYLDQHGKLIGYDSRTHRFVGVLEPPDASVSGPFLVQPGYFYYNAFDDLSTKLISTARAVYQVDFRERTVKSVYALSNDDEIGGFVEAQSYNSKDYLITTRHSVCLLDEVGHPIFNVPYQPGYAEYPQVEVIFLQPTNGSTSQYAVEFFPDYSTNLTLGWKLPDQFLWLGPEHTVTKNLSLPVLYRYTPDTPWSIRIVNATRPLPLCIWTGELEHPLNYVFYFSFATICAVIGVALGRRYNFSAAACVGWALFILSFGITGLLALLCAQEWPRRETCPHCLKLRAVDRESCEHCGASFNAPAKNGTEIFAPLAKV